MFFLGLIIILAVHLTDLKKTSSDQTRRCFIYFAFDFRYRTSRWKGTRQKTSKITQEKSS